jgi:hypothetical protein
LCGGDTTSAPGRPSILGAWPDAVFCTHGAKSPSVKSTTLPAPFLSMFLNIGRSSIELKLFGVGYQRPELMRNTNGDYGRYIGVESRFESCLDFLRRVSGHSHTAKGLGGCDDIESG